MNRIHCIAGVLVSMVVATESLLACSCVPLGGKRVTCEHYQSTEAVFVGVVINVDPPFQELLKQALPRLQGKLAQKVQTGEQLSYPEQRELLANIFPEERDRFLQATEDELERLKMTGIRKVRLQVTEPFRGIAEREVEFASGESSCDVDFKQGMSYLVFASLDKQTGELRTGVCSGTTTVDYAQEKLNYMRALKRGEIQSRFFGFLTAEPNDIRIPYSATKPLAGVSVTAKSEGGTWQTVSDQKGDYELDVPPGTYVLSADLPNLPPSQASRTVEVKSESCSRQNFLSTPVGSISGRIVDAQGNPVAKVLVELQAVPPTPQPKTLVQPFTKDDGQFSHRDLRRGEYLIGVNLSSPPRLRNYLGWAEVPYPPTYYPGVTDRTSAQVLSIDGSSDLENLEFKLPPPLLERTISGTVEGPDGSPARSSIRLMDLGYQSDSCKVDNATTNARGEFTIQGLEGRPYLVIATARKGEQWFQSDAVEVQQGWNLPIRLKLQPKYIMDMDGNCETVKKWNR